MPFKTTVDGKEITAYTEQEHADALKGMVTEAVANSRAATARREADAELTKAKGRVAELETQAAELPGLREQLEALKNTTGRHVDWLKVADRIGLPLPVADFIFKHPDFAAQKFGTDEEVAATKEFVTKTLGAGVLKATGTETNANGNGGNGNGGNGNGNNNGGNAGGNGGNGNGWQGQGGSPTGNGNAEPKGLAEALATHYAKN